MTLIHPARRAAAARAAAARARALSRAAAAARAAAARAAAARRPSTPRIRRVGGWSRYVPSLLYLLLSFFPSSAARSVLSDGLFAPLVLTESSFSSPFSLQLLNLFHMTVLPGGLLLPVAALCCEFAF